MDFMVQVIIFRQQRVLFHDKLSDWGTVSIGVSQGSI